MSTPPLMFCQPGSIASKTLIVTSCVRLKGVKLGVSEPVRGSNSPAYSVETSSVPLNCVFHDGSLIITDFGDITAVTDQAPMDGRLWRVDVGVEGMPLFFRGSIAARS